MSGIKKQAADALPRGKKTETDHTPIDENIPVLLIISSNRSFKMEEGVIFMHDDDINEDEVVRFSAFRQS